MRVSTLQVYRQGVDAMQKQQSAVQRAEMQIASGLRIMKPSDDPSGAVKVLDLSSSIAVIDQFTRNVGVAESALALEETVVASVNTNLQRIRELVVQGNNATNSDLSRQNISQEIYQRLDELIALGNTKNASGDYIFGGFKVDSPPFVSTGGAVTYQGDEGQRFIQVSEGTQVAAGDSGDAVFQKIATGDGNIQVKASPANTGTVIVGSFGLSGNFIPDQYTVTFEQAIATDPVTYTVTDSSNNTVTTGTYEDGASIAFAGAQFAVSGTPDDGDTVALEPSRAQDIFTTVKNIADALATATPLDADKANFHNVMAQGLANLDQGFSNLVAVRAGIGARLNNIETMEGVNQDFKVQLQTVLSDTQDLDYAEAISRFNLQLTSLKAAQQAFVKTTGLSLFQYI